MSAFTQLLLFQSFCDKVYVLGNFLKENYTDLWFPCFNPLSCLCAAVKTVMDDAFKDSSRKCLLC